jgi:hypothetical protein
MNDNSRGLFSKLKLLSQQIGAGLQLCVKTRQEAAGAAACVAAFGAFGALIVQWHNNSQSALVPFFDGCRHVAGVCNVASFLRMNGLGDLLSHEFVGDVMVPYFVMSLPTLLVGFGRTAFGLGWVLCLLALLIVLFTAVRRENRFWELLLAGSIMLAIGVFQAEHGGARDTRLDLLALTATSIAVVFLVEGRYRGALAVATIALFLKSSVLFLVVPLLVIGLIVYRPSSSALIPATRREWALPVATVGLLSVFFWEYLEVTLFYFLMATGGDSTGERVGNLVSELPTSLLRGLLYYPWVLLQHTNFWLTLAVPAAVFYQRKRIVDDGAGASRLGIYTLTCGVFTYLLMAAHPLHSRVLIVYFLPFSVLAALYLSRLVTDHAGIWVSRSLATVLSIAVLALTPASPPSLQGDEAIAKGLIFEHAREIAEFLDDRPSQKPDGVFILGNFVAHRGRVLHAIDAYRNLIYEHTRSADLLITGGEIGYTSEWKVRMQGILGTGINLLIVQEHPHLEKVPFGREIWEVVQEARERTPHCLDEVALPVDMPHYGRQEVYVLRRGEACGWE